MGSLDKIGIPKLRGSENYITWSTRTKATLIKEDLLSSLSEGSSEPKNNKGLAIIKLLCEDGPLLYIKDIDNAKKAWEKLESIYNPKGFTTEFLTLKEFFNTSLDDFDSMEEYLFKVKALVDDLKSKDITLPKQVVMAWVLNSLSQEYEGFISNITQALRNDPNAYNSETLFSSLIDESRGKEKGSQKLLFTSNKAKNGSKSNSKAYKKLSNSKFCSYCKLSSHETEKCFFLFPDKAPRGWKIKKNQKNSQKTSQKNKEALITSLSKLDTSDLLESSQESEKEPEEVNTIHDSSSSKEPTMDYTLDFSKESTNNWEDDNQLFDIIDTEVCLPCYNLNNKDNAVTDNQLDDLVEDNDMLYNQGSKIHLILDSAATINTVFDMKYFYIYREVNKTVNWGKANTLKVKFQGDILIKYSSGYIHIIRDVYYVPELGINLLSIDKMPTITSLFTKEKAILYNSKKNNQYITTGYKKSNLYIIEAIVLYPKNHILSLNNDNKGNNLYKWHNRLGHIGLIPLKIILDSKGIKITDKDIKKDRKSVV